MSEWLTPTFVGATSACVGLLGFALGYIRGVRTGIRLGNMNLREWHIKAMQHLRESGQEQAADQWLAALKATQDK